MVKHLCVAGPARIVFLPWATGAAWGTLIGVGYATALITVVALAGNVAALVLMRILVLFGAPPGALLGFVTGLLASVALNFAGPDGRRNRSRLIAGTAAAVPGGSGVTQRSRDGSGMTRAGPDVVKQSPVDQSRRILCRGLGYGAIWGAILGSVFIVVLGGGAAISTGRYDEFGSIIYLIPFAAPIGAIVGGLVGALVGGGLMPRPTRIRNDRNEVRRVAAAVATMPAVVVLAFVLASGSAGPEFFVVAAVAATAVTAATALAPRVAYGKRGVRAGGRTRV